MNPTPLMPGARKDLLDRLPEAERAVADREVRRNLQPTLFDVDEKLAPALGVRTSNTIKTRSRIAQCKAQDQPIDTCFWPALWGAHEPLRLSRAIMPVMNPSCHVVIDRSN